MSPDPSGAVAFPPLAHNDLARLRRWLNTRHVYEWWGRHSGPGALGGSGDAAATAAEVEAKYAPDIPAHGPTHRYVIEVDGAPVGLIQWYRLSDFPEYAGEIGEADRLGAGLGSAAIDVFVRSVVFAADGVTRATAGPDVRNRGSIRAFEKAAFQWVRDAEVRGETGPEPVMVRDRG